MKIKHDLTNDAPCKAIDGNEYFDRANFTGNIFFFLSEEENNKPTVNGLEDMSEKLGFCALEKAWCKYDDGRNALHIFGATEGRVKDIDVFFKKFNAESVHQLAAGEKA